MRKGSGQNGTDFSFFGCPFFLAFSRPSRRRTVSPEKGVRPCNATFSGLMRDKERGAGLALMQQMLTFSA